ncbi:MAG: hypothetical protein ABL961_18675 [Vicinamibacterales bacterium]
MDEAHNVNHGPARVPLIGALIEWENFVERATGIELAADLCKRCAEIARAEASWLA